MYHLTPRPLTAAEFSPFGDVIEVGERHPIVINDGNTERFDSLTTINLGDTINDQAVINIFRAKARKLPMPIKMMERHPLGSQAFYPLSGHDYLVLVAEPHEQLQPEHLHLFLATASQGVNYHPNTWHHPILALHDTSDFLVIDRKGAGNNCDEFFFNDSDPIEIVLGILPRL